MRRSIPGLVLLTMALLAAGAVGQPPAVPPPAVSVPSSPPGAVVPQEVPAPAPEALPRDPTVPTGELKSILDKGKRPAEAAAKPVPPKLPELILRGRIQVAGKPARAILEAPGGTMYIVTAGSRLTIAGGPGEGIVLQVVAVTMDEIQVEAPATHQNVVVR